MPQRLQRKRTKGWRMPEGAVYVGRPTKWGNPYGGWYLRFHFGVEMAIALYDYMARGMWNPTLLHGHSDICVNQAYLDNQKWIGRLGGHPKELIASELRGKDLACWCPLDQPCHADVLLELANRESS